MGFELGIFGEPNASGLEPEFIEWLVEERWAQTSSHFAKLWDYYSNPVYEAFSMADAGAKVGESSRCYVQAQEYGLPPRITGFVCTAGGGVIGGKNLSDVQRKEVVIENDIAWRVNAAVDFLFGKPIGFVSKSPDSQKRAEIESILKALFAANGGIGFFQDMAVLGGVYGFVDCLVRPGREIFEQFTSPSSFSSKSSTLEGVLQVVRHIELEMIEAPRALPILDEYDYRKINYYVQHFYQRKNALIKGGSFLSRLLSRICSSGRGGRGFDSREVVAVTEIISAKAWQRYENKELVSEGEYPWEILPVVHIQNIAQPYYYEGLSDLEPLITLQDELNTRLSDRASRITFQAFKMYLGKGIEGFEDRPVSPGRMWYTDNPDASIEEFGGDASAPSEDVHIAKIREAMDKKSGVTTIVDGVIKYKIGNLKSAVELRMTMMGMIAKTERKRFTFGEGMKKICGMVLEILD